MTARVRLHGVHRKEPFGISAIGRHVWWYGAPFFPFDGGEVKDLCVLGDIHCLIDRLKHSASKVAEFKTSV
ncbi:hypothetical protein [Rhizobium tubonense]|uniref:Uncharacterized protein n=1 Tax=Rhizobium tubonense TaxID=484088 RepID=A0A2W4C4Z1_9HYPH|nr:hypothetical protein [Rhizobium tubonense]PZM08749.1 hypothetical protein CPY51_27610 [Rhizobium tubonense]